MALINAINHKLDNAKKKNQKRKKIVKRWKTKIIFAKHYKVRKRINLSNIKKENYKSNIKNNINLNKANNKYLL